MTRNYADIDGKVQKMDKGEKPVGNNKKKCDGHTPTKVLELGGGVWAGSKYESKPHWAKFPVIANCTGNAMFSNYNHKIPFDWGKSFEKPTINEILLDWDNGKGIFIHPDFWYALRNWIIDTKAKILVCCEGGHGRTGTALVALILAANNGWETWDAINHVRKIYCSEAVETKSQVEYLQDLEKYFKGEK